MPEIISKESNSYWSRSVVKAISWRIVGSIDTLILGFIFTQSVKISMSIASTEVLTKIFLYTMHERAWSHTRFGLRKKFAGTPQA